MPPLRRTNAASGSAFVLYSAAHRSTRDHLGAFIMTIAILAWGSLVWDPRAQGQARRDGHAALLVNDQRQAAIELAI
jgi:cation transport regulator ChaC